MSCERAGGGADNTTSSASHVGGDSVTPAGMRMVTTGGTIEDSNDTEDDNEFVVIAENITDVVDPEKNTHV